MTLAVNLGVMTRRVLRRARLTWTARATERRAPAWPAPAIDPRLLIAVVLIFAELMLVTAVALFFSTFSSPLLATLLTLGLWVAGHFNADLRQFENVVDVAGRRRGSRAALYYLLPNLAPFDVKAEVVHGVPVAVRARRLTRSPTRRSTSASLLTAAMAIFRRRDFK